ncbi:hypothetical protein HOI83_04745 [Candidatus Uhrbacteria bacterium]|nr:hypothetical protein [Candidatus Uhrbacteria bacterium]
MILTILLLGAVGIGGLFAYQNRHEIQQDVIGHDVPEAVTFEELEVVADEVVGGNDELEDADVSSNEKVASPTDEDSARNDVLEVADDAGDIIDEEILDLTDVGANATKLASINLAIPFTSQAPHSNWDLPYQEACEEASVLMAVSFFDKELVNLSSADEADEAILSVVAFETDKYDLFLDTTAAETKRFAEAMYPGYGFDLLSNPSVDDIKTALSNGSPVIVPAAGRELGNPNFTGAGPLYHMLVLRGYTDSTFVTNDPGTRNGNGYVYKQKTIMDAMGDWNAGDPANGAKVVIVVTKK